MCRIYKITIKLLVAIFLAATSMTSFADIERALENYLLIIKEKKQTSELSSVEADEVLEVHERLKGFGRSVGSGCNSVIESQIDGDFKGWDGETIFKLTNGQIWQQSEYAYTYSYSFMPEVMIYLDGGVCKLKVDGVTDTIGVREIG